jgi:hypothetical protein
MGRKCYGGMEGRRGWASGQCISSIRSNTQPLTLMHSPLSSTNKRRGSRARSVCVRRKRVEKARRWDETEDENDISSSGEESREAGTIIPCDCAQRGPCRPREGTRRGTAPWAGRGKCGRVCGDGGGVSSSWKRLRDKKADIDHKRIVHGGH